jgi:hypothetical protein
VLAIIDYYRKCRRDDMSDTISVAIIGFVSATSVCFFNLLAEFFREKINVSLFRWKQSRKIIKNNIFDVEEFDDVKFENDIILLTKYVQAYLKIEWELVKSEIRNQENIVCNLSKCP